MSIFISVLIPVFLPFLFAVLSLMRGRKSASAVLITGSVMHFAASVVSLFSAGLGLNEGGDQLCRMLYLNRESRLILALISFVFLASCVYFVIHSRSMKRENLKPLFPQSVCCCVMLAFLGSMALVLAARDLGLLWVAIEATTLFSAPLIIFYRTGGAVEAMWKYLLICSVGIGFALFGTLLIACSVPGDAAPGLSLDLLGNTELDPLLFKLGFVFILAGYGTKADLAPFHNWIPDTYSESYGPASALISGTLLNASFIALLKILEIAPENARPFCNQVLMVLGFLSVGVAGFFVIRQYDCKRMLGYSSIEHMGLAMLMTVSGLRGIAICHLFCHALLKCGLFMTSENCRLACGTRRIDDIRGLFAAMPLRSLLWIGSLILICGMPPGPLFFTEYMLIKALKNYQALILIVLLFLIFAGMLHAALRMISGKSSRQFKEKSVVLDIVPLVLSISAIVCGLLLLWFQTVR